MIVLSRLVILYYKWPSKNEFNVNHSGLTITLKNPISDLANTCILSKSFKNGVYWIPNLPSSSYWALNSLFTFSDHILDSSNTLAPPLKSAVWTIIPVNNFKSSSPCPNGLLLSSFLILASKSFNNPKWTLISVYKILSISILLNYVNYSLFRFDKKF